MSEPDGGLGDFWSVRAKDDLSEAADFCNRGVIDKREVVGRGVVRAEYVRDDLEGLENVVVDQESVDKHEYSLWYLEGIFECSGGLRLEMLDGIV